jgi:hypothetical protein
MTWAASSRTRAAEYQVKVYHQRTYDPALCLTQCVSIRISMASQSTLRKKTPLLVLLAAVLLARSRLLTGPADVIAKLRKAGFKRGTISDDELQQTLQQIYTENSDGSKSLLVPYRGRVSEVRVHVMHTGLPTYCVRRSAYTRPRTRSSRKQHPRFHLFRRQRRPSLLWINPSSASSSLSSV